MQKIKFEVSTWSIIKFILIILLIGFIFYIKEVLLILFSAFVISSAINPLADKLQKRKIPRFLSVLLVYFILGGIIVGIGILILPAIKEQIQLLAINLPNYYQFIIEKFSRLANNPEYQPMLFQLRDQLFNLANNLSSFSQEIIPKVRDFFGGSIKFLLVLVISLYLVVEDRDLKRFFQSILPAEYQPYITNLTLRIQRKIGGWLLGQLFLSAIIFTLVSISLFIIGVRYWLLLGLIAGLLEIIPFIGPFVSATIAVVLTIGSSILKSILIIILYIIIQQLENHLIVPQVMKKTVGLNPILVILSILIGAKLGGILGAILAIPLVSGIQEFLKDIFQIKSEEDAS